MTSHKCGGACCRRFILPYSPEELREQYQMWLVSGGRGGNVMQKGTAEEEYQLRNGMDFRDTEIYLLYPMLVYLGHHNWDPCNPSKKHGIKAHHYTCKHYDKKTKLCTIYDIRPQMCRRYPNGHACTFPSCKIPGNKKKLEQERREVVEGVSPKLLTELKSPKKRRNKCTNK